MHILFHNYAFFLILQSRSYFWIKVGKVFLGDLAPNSFK